MSQRTARPRVCMYSKMWRASGTGLFVQQAVLAMRDAGADVLMVAPRSDDNAFEDACGGVTRWRPVRELETSAPRFLRMMVSAARCLMAALMLLAARTRRKVFVVSISDPLVMMAPVFLLLKLSGARIIWIVHDPLPHAWTTRGLLRKFEKAGFQLVYGLSDCLVTLAKSGEDVLRCAYRLSAKRIVHIEHGAFPPGPYAPPPRACRLLLFGTLRANKGVSEAIRGVIQARIAGIGVHLTIAGGAHGPERDYWSLCKAETERRPDAFEIIEGYVSDGALVDLIAGCDAFLMPYRDFSSQSGVAVLALANGRPIIATPVGGIADLFDDGAPGVIIKGTGDPEDVADAIIRFSGLDHAALERESLAYRTRQSERRSWAAIAPRYLEVVRSLEA